MRPKAGVKKSSGILDSFFHDFKGGSMCQKSLHITSIFKIYNRINMEHYFLFLFHSLMISFGNVSDQNSFSYQHERGKPRKSKEKQKSYRINCKSIVARERTRKQKFGKKAVGFEV